MYEAISPLKHDLRKSEAAMNEWSAILLLPVNTNSVGRWFDVSCNKRQCQLVCAGGVLGSRLFAISFDLSMRI